MLDLFIEPVLDIRIPSQEIHHPDKHMSCCIVAGEVENEHYKAVHQFGFLEDMKWTLNGGARFILLYIMPFFIFWYVIGVITFKENSIDSFTLPK